MHQDFISCILSNVVLSYLLLIQPRYDDGCNVDGDGNDTELYCWVFPWFDRHPRW